MGNRWKNFWHMNVPGKVKIFLRQVGSDLLATRRNMFHNKIVENPQCLICLQEEETKIHVLWQCLAANDVWIVARNPVQKWRIA